MKRPSVRWLLVLPLVLAVAFAFMFMRRGPGAGPEVTVASARTESLTPKVFGIGTVEARRSYTVGPTLASRVAAVNVDHGDRVRAGQVLAELDPVDLDERAASAASAQARAAAAAEAAAAQVREARSRAEVAAANASRFRDLRAKNFVSQEAADAKAHEANAARAGLDAAEASLDAARRDQARLASDRAGIGRQRAQYRLSSPIDGIVLARDAEPGSTVVAGQAVLRLLDPASLWVRTRIDQGRAAGLAVGQPASILLRSRPEAPLPGRVARIEIASDSVTEERIVDVAFAEPPAGLSPGELAEVTVSLPGKAQALVVPTAALRQSGGRPGVLKLIDGRTEFVPVRTGLRSLEGGTEILEGLREGDSVVHHAAAELKGGERVRVKESLVK